LPAWTKKRERNREGKVKGSDGEIGRNWNQVHNKEKDRKNVFSKMKPSTKNEKAGTVNME